MPKERVIVFDGEDQFIAPRNVSYDVASGEANVVGDERSQVVGVMRPDIESNLVDSGAKKEFDDYMRRQGQTVSVPSPVEPDFCLRVRQFIQSNGEGMATGQQIMEAHQLFQQHCVEKPKETPVVPPVGDVKPDDGIAPPPAPPVPPTTPVEPSPKPATPLVTLPSVSLTTPSLGARPSGGGAAGGGGGGGEEKKKEEKKPNWLLWLLIAAGVVYLAKRKKD